MCHAGRGERASHAIIGVVLTAFSASLFTESVTVGILARPLSVLALAMAIIGFCTSGWLPLHYQPDEADALLSIHYVGNVMTLEHSG